MKVQSNERTKFKVLCADSRSGVLAQYLRGVCGEDGELLIAEDGHEALMLLKLHGDEIKLAVLNSLLPILDGISLCRSIRKSSRWTQIPIVLVGEPDDGFPNELESDHTVFLRRPYSKARFSETVDRFLNPLNCQWTRFRCRAVRGLVVDDTDHVRKVLRKYLTGMDIEVSEADSSVSMEREISKQKPDLILLDLMMPGEDGLTILKRLRKNPETKSIPVIIISGIGEVEVVAEALENGAVDYLTKPICFRRLKARVKNCLDVLRLRFLEKERHKELRQINSLLQRRVETYMTGLQKSQHGTIFALSKLAESRDPETGEHLERLREYCKALCRALLEQGDYVEVLTEDFIENLAAASPLHDIGKVGIPDSVLLKPGRLTSEEFDIMKTHAQIGADTLMAATQECGNNPLLEMGIEIAQFHHEKWDGNGYPVGLRGEAIPLSARILALGDVYDALTSKRVYKEAFSHEKSRAIILEGSGSHFDPKVVDAFLAAEEQFRMIRQNFSDSNQEMEKVAS